jgi:inner membrane protein
MDNLSHSLIGLAVSKAGLEKLSPGASALCVIAANAPDADIVTALFGGRWVYLQNHRGITHSIAGTLLIALLLPSVFYLFDFVISRLRKKQMRLRWKGALVASLVASATHPLMDWTNNYGVRFLLPWNPRWFYGDFVFIIDPVFWIILGGAVFLVTSKTRKQLATWLVLAAIPTVLVFVGPMGRGGLNDATFLRVTWVTTIVILVILFQRDVGGRWEATVPRAAFGVVAIYLLGLFLMHAVALRHAKVQALGIASTQSEQIVKVAAMPTLANPLHWQAAVETEKAAYRFDVTLPDGSAGNFTRRDRPEALNERLMSQALSDPRTQIFLGFARFPVAQISGEDCASQTLVQFADLRYTEPGRGRGTFSLDVPVDCPVQK